MIERRQNRHGKELPTARGNGCPADSKRKCSAMDNDGILLIAASRDAVGEKHNEFVHYSAQDAMFCSPY